MVYSKGHGISYNELNVGDFGFNDSQGAKRPEIPTNRTSSVVKMKKKRLKHVKN